MTVLFCLTLQDNPCKKKRSFFALCVRRASEENLYNGCNKPVANTNRSVTLPALKPFTVTFISLHCYFIYLFHLFVGGGGDRV